MYLCVITCVIVSVIYSNRTVSISDKCIVGEVDSYCQLAVTFFVLVSPYQTRQCSA